MPRLSARLLLDSFYRNFPKAYVDQEKGIRPKKIFGNRFGAEDTVLYEVHPDDYVPDALEPWSIEAKMARKRNEKKLMRHRAFLPNWQLRPPKLHRLPPNHKPLFFVGDRVEVLVGKDRGKQGVISELIPERNWCYVTGLNCVYKTVSPTGFDAQMVLESQHLELGTEVALVDPADDQTTEAEWRWTEAQEQLRVSCRTGRHIPVPSKSHECYEYSTRETYKETPKDTPEASVKKVTYIPEVVSFEQSIEQEYQLTAGAKMKPTYWY